MHPLNSRLRLCAIAALAGISVTILLLTRPSLPAGSWSRGDDLALAAAWVVALAASVWLFTVSTACLLALGMHRPHLARVLACALPPALRRSVEVAIVASCLAVSAAPAHAVNSGPRSVIDQPVVREPGSLAAAPSTVSRVAPRPTPRTTTLRREAPAAPASGPAPAHRSSPATSIAPASRSTSASARPSAPGTAADSSSTPGSPQPSPGTRVVVRPGDNLWLIARTELIRSTGAYPNDRDVARYWRAVIDANRATLRSGDPSLIYPGEIVALPPVRSVS